MSEFGDLAARSDGHLIKVLEVLDGGDAFLGRATNGGTARFSLGQQADIRRGSVVFVSDDMWQVVPETAWPEIPEVAIIRRILDDGLLIEFGAGIRYVPGKPTVEIAVGNTVQFNEVDGVLRVLEQGPVRYRDEGIGDDSIDEYLVPPGVDGPTFASFAGYHDVRRRAVELIETQLKNREQVSALGARPVKGISFTGPPGTGKTHLARVIAHESGASFYLISGPSIVSIGLGTASKRFVASSALPLRRTARSSSSTRSTASLNDERRTHTRHRGDWLRSSSLSSTASIKVARTSSSSRPRTGSRA